MMDNLLKGTYEYLYGDVIADMMDNLLKGNLWIFIRECRSRHDGQHFHR